MLSRNKAYRLNNKDKVRAMQRAWEMRTKEKNLEVNRRRGKKATRLLTAGYVKNLIRNSVAIPAHLVPPQLVESVRAYILVMRQIKENRA